MFMNLAVASILGMASPPNGGSGAGQAGGWIVQLAPLAVIFAIFYLLMIRPQQKQQKKLREMLTALKKGDRVVTRGGMLGTIHGIADNIVTVEVAENVRLKFNRDAIAGVQAATGQ